MWRFLLNIYWFPWFQLVSNCALDVLDQGDSSNAVNHTGMSINGTLFLETDKKSLQSGSLLLWHGSGCSKTALPNRSSQYRRQRDWSRSVHNHKCWSLTEHEEVLYFKGSMWEMQTWLVGNETLLVEVVVTEYRLSSFCYVLLQGDKDTCGLMCLKLPTIKLNIRADQG